MANLQSPTRVGLAWTAVALAAFVIAAASSVQAQPRASIRIGTITSEKQCTIYQESAGSSAVVATRNVIVAAESWRTWLVKDCIDNFATLRTSLEAALAATGKFTVTPQGAAYVLSGAISDIGEGGGPVPNPAPYTNGYKISSRNMFVNMDVTLRDTAGRTIYGGLLTKKIETESAIGALGFRTSSSQSGQGLYGELQHQVALSVARLIAFRVVPLRVVGADGGRIELNYGSPLLSFGDLIDASGPDGRPIRYRVSSATDATAWAQVVGTGGAGVPVGATATYIDADSAAANARTIQRVELP